MVHSHYLSPQSEDDTPYIMNKYILKCIYTYVQYIYILNQIKCTYTHILVQRIHTCTTYSYIHMYKYLYIYISIYIYIYKFMVYTPAVARNELIWAGGK
jgi:hypothetical protein